MNPGVESLCRTGSLSAFWGLDHHVANHSSSARPGLPTFVSLRDYNPVMQQRLLVPALHNARSSPDHDGLWISAVLKAVREKLFLSCGTEAVHKSTLSH